MIDYQSIITIEPGKRSGKPCIRGMRITVYDVLEYLAGGMTEAEILEDFSELTSEDIKACLAFAADREKKVIGHSNKEGLMRKPSKPQDHPGKRAGGEHPDEAMSSKRWSTAFLP
jgi:uncharacterized protein (DUF433 family)